MMVAYAETITENEFRARIYDIGLSEFSIPRIAMETAIAALATMSCTTINVS